MLTFGPIPSRRLGRSLGINNIPLKVCSYSCVYCQVGKTLVMQADRGAFYKSEDILKAVREKIKRAKDKGEEIDYLTFVSDGEPTLDIDLGKKIELLRPLGFKIAIISNVSLITREDVRDDLCKADWVSLKIDTVDKDVWYEINRPHSSLQLDEMLQAVLVFSDTFKGQIATETMLIQGINDSRDGIDRTANFMAKLKNAKSYISIPTRPPTEKWVKPATEDTINIAYQTFKKKSIDVEYLIGYEGNAFAFTGNVEEDLLSITSVHPMREEAVIEFLKKGEAEWALIERLIKEAKLVRIEYEGKKFYMRKLQI